MSGNKNLRELLRNMEPELDGQEYIFATFSRDSAVLDSIDCWARIQEREGITCILTAASAAKIGIRAETVFRKITLMVHSSLEAVGLTAAVSRALSDRNISANIVAGFYHDHIFIPAKSALEALEALRSLSRNSTPG